MPDSEFEAIRARLSAKRVSIGGRRYYVAERDLLLDDAQLIEHAHMRVAAKQRPEQAPSNHAFVDKRRRLLAVTRGGRIVRWKDGLVLSYTIAQDSFAHTSDSETVRKNMADAARAWEEVCGVRFVHREVDDSPSDGTQAATFAVAAEDTQGELIAAAFFPDDPPDRRVVIIDPSYFAASLQFDPVGVLRHELGHVLGFRHEHIRAEGLLECEPEDLTDTQAVTLYDSQSVMHYLCDGFGSPLLELTDVDRDGAQRIYGPPFGLFEFVS